MTRYHEDAITFLQGRLNDLTKERDEALAKLAKARDLWAQIDATHDLRCSACYLEHSGVREWVSRVHPECDCGLRELTEVLA